MGYESLPEWVKEGEEPDAKLRDEGPVKEVYGERKDVPAARELDKAVEKKGLGNLGVGGGKDKTLDAWLAEEEESEEGSTEEETESESEEESSEEEESESEREEEGDRLVRS